MRKEIFGNGLWLLAGNIVTQVMQLVTFLLLARMLEPQVFGYVALATVFLDVAAQLSQWGLISAAQQRRGFPSDRLLSHIFGFSLLIALLISGALAAGIAVYAYYFGFDLVAQLILWLIPVLIFQNLGIAPESVLFCRMQFKWLAVRNNIAALLGGAVAIGLALMGFGVYALVAQRLVALATLCSIVWIAAGKEIKILSPRQYDFRLFRALLKTGGVIVSSPVAAILSGRTMDGFIGMFLGPAVLGGFKITSRIFDLVQQFTVYPLRNVTWSAFPKLVARPQELYEIYKDILIVTAVLVLPAFAGIGAVADELVPLVIGAQWLPAIPLFKIYAVSGLASVMLSLQISILVAYRKNTYVLWQNILSAVVLGVATFVTARINAQAAVWAFVGVGYLNMVLNEIVIGRVTGWTPFKTLSHTIPPLIASGVMVCSLLFLSTRLPPEQPVINLAIKIGAGAVIYGVLIVVFYRHKLRQLVKKIVEQKNGMSAAPSTIDNVDIAEAKLIE